MIWRARAPTCRRDSPLISSAGATASSGLRVCTDCDRARCEPLAPAVKYQALASGAVDVIDGYSTDGLLARYDLETLVDDRHFFPPYEAAALVSSRLGPRTARSDRGAHAAERTARRANDASAESPGRSRWEDVSVVARRRADGIGPARRDCAKRRPDQRLGASGFCGDICGIAARRWRLYRRVISSWSRWPCSRRSSWPFRLACTRAISTHRRAGDRDARSAADDPEYRAAGFHDSAAGCRRLRRRWWRSGCTRSIRSPAALLREFAMPIPMRLPPRKHWARRQRNG